MGNKATTIKEQIQKLTDRGLVLDLPSQKIEEILLDIGYYRLGFYWYHFQENTKTHFFKTNIKFTDVIRLYYLDIDLKHILIKYLHRIEINIRTKIIYIASNFFKDNPAWFADKRYMKSDFVDNFKTHYNNIKEGNSCLKKHHQTHRNDIYAPAWKTLEFLSFGAIYNLFCNIKNDECRNEIVKVFGLKKESIFLNYFQTIKFIRNLSAHSGTLYDCTIPKGVKASPWVKITNDNRHKITAGIEVILFFLNKISKNRENELRNEWEKSMFNITDNQTIKGIIEQKTGFSFANSK